MKKVMYSALFLVVFAMSSFNGSNTVAIDTNTSALAIDKCAASWYSWVVWARDQGMNTQQAHAYANEQLALCYANCN